MTIVTQRIVVTGGGTGGHITPALAVAELLRQLGHHVDYIGNANSLESRMAQEKSFPFHAIVFSGMPRKLGLAWFSWLGSLLAAILQAIRLLQEVKPHTVFGTGGYVAAPVLLAARLLNIPSMIHEADAQPGLVNRLTAGYATVVSTAFSQARLPHAVVTGNPVRSGLGQLSKTEACARLRPEWLTDGVTLPVVLVMGGSQGAKRLNEALMGALADLLPYARVIHQLGPKLFEATMATMPPALAKHPGYWPTPFINDMPAALSLADVALCRAGSLTLSELFVAGIPAILVPYPYAAANHQMKNAQAAEKAGAAWIIADDDLTSSYLIETLIRLLQSQLVREQMRQAALALAKPEATQDITARLLAISLA